MILPVLIAMVAGWVQRYQQEVIAYLIEENRVLKAQLGGRQLRLTDTERRRLAALAHPLGRKRLKEMATLATPETLLRWYKRLCFARKVCRFDTSPLQRQRYASRLLLDSRVVGFADVVPPNCCHPFLLEALLFQ